MKIKHATKDEIAQYCVIIVSFGILVLIHEYSTLGSVYRNAGGIAFEIIGFIVMLTSDRKSNLRDRHKRTWQTGIALVIFGLVLQFTDVWCTEYPQNCS